MNSSNYSNYYSVVGIRISVIVAKFQLQYKYTGIANVFIILCRLHVGNLIDDNALRLFVILFMKLLRTQI